MECPGFTAEASLSTKVDEYIHDTRHAQFASIIPQLCDKEYAKCKLICQLRWRGGDAGEGNTEYLDCVRRCRDLHCRD
jgi:hypothetical protein